MQARLLANKLAVRCEEVVRYLLPNGKKVRHHWQIGNVLGEKGASLKVTLSQSKCGYWYDFATGEGGDLLQLWRLNRRITLSQAIKQAKAWLGITEPYFSPHNIKKFDRPSPDTLVNNPLSDRVKQYLIQERKLTQDTLSIFKVSATQDAILFPYWKDNTLIQVKKLLLKRPQGKKNISVIPNCEPTLFGWQTLSQNERTITLTEGEIDCMTLHQYGIPALSIPYGGGFGKKQAWIEYEFDRLNHFDEIFLCFDQDTVGKATTEIVASRLGRHRCRVVELPYKDVNECLQNNVSSDEIKKHFIDAKQFDPIELKSAHVFDQDVINLFYQPESDNGLTLPWSKAKHLIRFRPEELTVWTGINGHGKSQLLGHVVLSSIQQGAKVCIASLELKPRRLLMRLARQASALPRPEKEHIIEIHKWYDGKLWLFDLVGTAKAERLLEVFLYAKQRYNISVFLIDSLMKCGISEEDYVAQKTFVEQLCDFKNEHACHIHLITHPRKGIDEQHMPSKLDVKGTGAITDLADNSLICWRNKKKEQAKQENNSHSSSDEADTLLRCDKQRNGDWEGKIALWFDQKSYQFLGHPNSAPSPFITYKNNQQ